MYYWKEATVEERIGEARMGLEGLDLLSWDMADRHGLELAEKLSEAQDANNPENAVIRRDLFRRLSDEAVEVFDLVMNVPSELLSIIAGKKSHRRLTPSDIRRYMTGERGWPGCLVDGTLAELRMLAENLLLK